MGVYLLQNEHYGLGDRLLLALRKLGKSQSWLSTSAGVSRQTLHRALHADSATPETLRKIAGALDVKIDDLTGSAHAGAAREPKISPDWSPRARGLANRLLAEIAESGASEEQEAWARRVLLAPSNYLPTESEEVQLRDMDALFSGVRAVLRNWIPRSAPEGVTVARSKTVTEADFIDRAGDEKTGSK